MTIQLRQICLVAGELEPVIQDLTAILGIYRCYIDQGVGTFGLENTLMPIGYNFLEVVAPIEENTAGGRYLTRRGGDGGYMVITQADSAATQQQVRQNALDEGVRVAHEAQRGDWNLCQLHPGDLKAAFLEIESDAHNDFTGNWHPVNGTGWEHKVCQDVTVDFTAVELQSPDPVDLAALWGRVTGLPVSRDGSEMRIELNNVALRFVEAQDGRGPGLSGLDIVVADREHILREAKQRNCYVSDDQVDICGVHWYLHDAG
ncbi:MAG: VOC family protein [Pseudomonadota bacterium]